MWLIYEYIASAPQIWIPMTVFGVCLLFAPLPMLYGMVFLNSRRKPFNTVWFPVVLAMCTSLFVNYFIIHHFAVKWQTHQLEMKEITKNAKEKSSVHRFIERD